MSDNRRKTVQWTPEQRTQHQAIREAFRDWHPGPEELIASGAAARLGLDVVHSPAQELLRQLKASREAAGLTLADVSARCGIDQPAVSRLENGHTPNPTLDTLWRYAAAVGKRSVPCSSTRRGRFTRLWKASRLISGNEPRNLSMTFSSRSTWSAGLSYNSNPATTSRREAAISWSGRSEPASILSCRTVTSSTAAL